jgi:hypothetical protein
VIPRGLGLLCNFNAICRLYRSKTALIYPRAVLYFKGAPVGSGLALASIASAASSASLSLSLVPSA